MKLMYCIGKERKLATYYGDGVLFQCGDHADDDRVDRVCCQKRLLILRMCDAILAWLNRNRAELQELQELYPCCRLEVYNRKTTARAFSLQMSSGSDLCGVGASWKSTKSAASIKSDKLVQSEKLMQSVEPVRYEEFLSTDATEPDVSHFCCFRCLR